MNLLEQKVVVITGAGRGLGKEYALYLAKQGVSVVVNDSGALSDGTGKDKTVADAVVAQIKEAGGKAVANHESIATLDSAQKLINSAIDNFGRIDALINNAGILRDKSFLKMTNEMWEAVIAVHLSGTFFCSQVAAQKMREQNQGGVIINTTSYAGLKGNFGQTNYSAANAGVYGMSLVLAQELARYNIRVNVIAPMAKTRMTENMPIIPDTLKAELVAPLVAFLCSDLASDINGRLFGVHGEQIFEYKVEMTPGATDTWTPQKIKERLSEISSSSLLTVAARTETTSSRSSKERVETAFEFMPKGFLKDRANNWSAVFHWEIKGSGDFTIKILSNECSISKGKNGNATCIAKTDTDTFLAIVQGTTDGQQAYMQGRLEVSNLSDMMKYQDVIDLKKARQAYAKAFPDEFPKEQTTETSDIEFSEGKQIINELDPKEGLRLMLGLVAEHGNANMKQPCIHLTAKDLHCTISTNEHGKVAVEHGHNKKPTSFIFADPKTLLKIWINDHPEKIAKTLFSQGAITATSMDDLCWMLTCFSKQPGKTLAKELELRGRGINKTMIGSISKTEPITISLEHIIDFAKATNDPNPWFVDISKAGGVIAPPLFLVRYLNEIYTKLITDPKLGITASRLLFGEMDMEFFAPLYPKETIDIETKIISVEDKDAGQLMRVLSLATTSKEEKVKAIATFFVRWPGRMNIKPFLVPLQNTESRSLKIFFEEPMEVRADQTYVFAKASNDPNPVHIDENFAKSVGLPGIIVHGLCSMAFSSRAFVQRVCDGTPTKLAQLMVRFSKPARPGQILTTRAFKPKKENNLTVYSFVVENNNKEMIITNGVAKIH